MVVPGELYVVYTNCNTSTTMGFGYSVEYEKLYPQNVIFELTQSYSPTFTTSAFEFTDYTSMTGYGVHPDCKTSTAEIALSTQFVVPNPSIAEESFISHIRLLCSHTNIFDQQAVSTTSSRSVGASLPVTTLTSPLVTGSGSPSQPIATTTNLSPSQHTKSPSADTGETSKLVIGLVVALVVVFLLVTMGLVHYCIVRKRRRRKDEAAKAHQDDANGPGGQGGNPQLYFQDKVELDDEQRRHEMEAVELRHEVQGLDEIHEMPADKGDRHCGRRELKGSSFSAELDNTHRSFRSSHLPGRSAGRVP